MDDTCTVCGLPTHADGDSGVALCRRCYEIFEPEEEEESDECHRSFHCGS